MSGFFPLDFPNKFIHKQFWKQEDQSQKNMLEKPNDIHTAL